MKILTDHYVYPCQKPQKICEDSALSGVLPVPYVILADGCSSSKNSDFGSKVLSLLAESILTRNLKDKDNINDIMLNEIIEKLKIMKTIMHSKTEIFDSTLIVSYIVGDCFMSIFYGDGYVFKFDDRDNIIQTYIKYPENAPFYISYNIDEKRLNLYQSSLLGRFKDVITNCKNDIVKYKKDLTDYHIDATGFGDNPLFYKKIMIASDGIESFINVNTGDKVPVEVIIKEFTAFKNISGEFVKKRVKRAIEDFQKQGIYNTDDLSVGCFIVTE